MAGPTNFVDDIDCGTFFDHIDDLLDFPEDNSNNNNNNSNVNSLIGGHSESYPDIWTASSCPFTGLDTAFAVHKGSNSGSDISTELYVPYEDIVQMEWLSNFVEDSYSGGSSGMPTPTCNKEHSSTNKDSSPAQSFRTSSPISVLESSSSCSGGSGGGKAVPLSPEAMPIPGRRGRPRSKRPRPATFNARRQAIQLIPSTSSFIGSDQPFVSPKTVSSESSNFAESCPSMKIPKPAPKPKKIKYSVAEGQEDTNGQNPQSTQLGVRKCLHCEITKTPQWRAGPLGPKTLCNACGVRYKSGRLFPEYRPAASPTFVPSLHSNSHKKVVEMRTRVNEKTSASAELIPNNNALVDYKENTAF